MGSENFMDSADKDKAADSCWKKEDVQRICL